MAGNICTVCNFAGTVADPSRRLWQLFRTVTCKACGGDGYLKPPGWPDRELMYLMRGVPSSPPPPIVRMREGSSTPVGNKASENFWLAKIAVDKIRGMQTAWLHRLAKTLGYQPPPVRDGDQFWFREDRGPVHIESLWPLIIEDVERLQRNAGDAAAR